MLAVAPRRTARPYRRSASLATAQAVQVDGPYFYTEALHRVTTVVGGSGRIEARLLDEIETRSGFANLISGIQDSRLGAMVRDFGAGQGGRRAAVGKRYHTSETTSRESLGTGSLQFKEAVLTTRQPTSRVPYQSVRIGVVDGYMGFLTPAMFETWRGLLSGDQVQVTLYSQGMNDVQKITALFERRSGRLVPGSVTEHALHSKLPLPFA